MQLKGHISKTLVLTSLSVIPNVDVYQVKWTALYVFCWNILPLILLLKQTNTAQSDYKAFSRYCEIIISLIWLIPTHGICKIINKFKIKINCWAALKSINWKKTTTLKRPVKFVHSSLVWQNGMPALIFTAEQMILAVMVMECHFQNTLWAVCQSQRNVGVDLSKTTCLPLLVCL